jgi:hypothetical protein
VNLTSEQPKALAAGETLEFTYAVKWVPTATPFNRRFERYLDYNFFEHQVPATSRQSRCEPLQRSGEGDQAATAELALVAGRSARGHWLMCVLLCARADPLVQHLQQLHDGAVPDGPGRHDPAAHAEARLCAVSVPQLHRTEFHRSAHGR